MLITISNVLDAEALRAATDTCGLLDWRDGAETAGRAARKVKNNQQADLSSSKGRALARELERTIRDHPVFKAAAWPRRFSSLLISKCGVGEGYGLHVDNAIMGRTGRRMRTDLSFTLFLSPPDTYDGGALVIETPAGTTTLKPEAGDLVVYPSTALHRVETVERGERLACVGWVESMVRDPTKREILFDLENLRAELAKTEPSEGVTALTLSKSIANLLRLWAEV